MKRWLFLSAASLLVSGTGVKAAAASELPFTFAIRSAFVQAYEREPHADEVAFWSNRLVSGGNTIDQFRRITFIHGTYLKAFNRGNTPGEFIHWDPLLEGQVTFEAFRRIVFIDAAFQERCGRTHTPAEYATWDRWLLPWEGRAQGLDALRAQLNDNPWVCEDAPPPWMRQL